MAGDRFGDDEVVPVDQVPSAPHVIMQTARVQIAWLEGRWQVTEPATLEADPDGPYCAELHSARPADRARCVLEVERANGGALPTRTEVAAAFERAGRAVTLKVGDPDAPTLS